MESCRFFSRPPDAVVQSHARMVEGRGAGSPVILSDEAAIVTLEMNCQETHG